MRKKLTRKQFSLVRRIKRLLRLTIVTSLVLCLALAGVHFTNEWIGKRQNILKKYGEEELTLDGVTLSNEVKIKEELLSINPYSRPGTKLHVVQGIVIHYVGNPGTSAINNRNYFEGLAKSHATSASSHFVVGLKGEIVQCIPLNEIAYASNERNGDTISIEVCHPDAEGKFNKKTYQSVVALTAYLCKMFELKAEDVIRHYDVTGKKCPLYYVEHEESWLKLKEEIEETIQQIGEIEVLNKKE